MFWNKRIVDLITQKMSEVFHRRVSNRVISLDRRIKEASESYDYSKAMKLSYRKQGLQDSLRIYKSSKQEVWRK